MIMFSFPSNNTPTCALWPYLNYFSFCDNYLAKSGFTPKEDRQNLDGSSDKWLNLGQCPLKSLYPPVMFSECPLRGGGAYFGLTNQLIVLLLDSSFP